MPNRTRRVSLTSVRLLRGELTHSAIDRSSHSHSYIHQLKGENIILNSQISSAHDRISHLEAVISAMEKGVPPPQVPTPDVDPTQTDFAALARTILSVRSATTSFAAAEPTEQGGTQFSASAQVPAPLPPYDVARAAAETFFIANAISYPFIDKDEFLNNMAELYARETKSANGYAQPEDERVRGREFIFFMVLAIGTTNRERLGEAARGASKEYRQRAMRGLPYAVAREDIVGLLHVILLIFSSAYNLSFSSASTACLTLPTCRCGTL